MNILEKIKKAAEVAETAAEKQLDTSVLVEGGGLRLYLSKSEQGERKYFVYGYYTDDSLILEEKEEHTDGKRIDEEEETENVLPFCRPCD